MVARTVIDLQAIALTVLILIFFAILAVVVIAANAIIVDIIEWLRGRQGAHRG